MSKTDDELAIIFNGLNLKRERIYGLIQTIVDSSATLTAATAPAFRPKYDRLLKLQNDFDLIQNEILSFNATLPGGSAFKLGVSKQQSSCDNLVDSAHVNYQKFTKEPELKEETKTAISPRSKVKLPP